MNFIERYSIFWADSTNTKDRISKNDFWLTVLILFISFVIIFKISSFLSSAILYFVFFSSASLTIYSGIRFLPYIFVILYAVVCIIPFVSMSIRRLNDVGLSHKHILSVFCFPLYVYYMCRDSTKSDNIKQ